jgi:hypothetical protein
MRKTLLVLMAALMPVPALAAPVLAAPVIDNDRVTVWDITLKMGEAAPAPPADRDTVIMFLEGGDIRTATNNVSVTMPRKFGDAVFITKGAALKLPDHHEKRAGGGRSAGMAAAKPVEDCSGFGIGRPRPRL